jgi:hypothetical protein
VLKAEFSRRPSSEADVKAFLGRTGADIHLYQGFSQVTLPAFVEQWRERPFHIDLIFIDGGHAEETIREDWRNVEQLLGPGTIAIFDDYYPEDYSAHIGRAGCQYVVDSLDRARYDVSVLEPQDCFQNGWGELRINLARVTMRQVPVEGAPAPRR